MKQLLMVAGYDRYFQIARCFRDEDLRADRQPEFTQLDMEMSFVDMEDIIDVVERLFTAMVPAVVPHKRAITPFMRMSYDHAVDRYGSDKPDLRYGLELVNLSEILAQSPFPVIQNALSTGGTVKAIRVPGIAGYSRKQIDELTEITSHSFGEVAYTARRPGLPCTPILAATNPDGAGHSWVKSTWRPHRAPTADGALSYICDEPWPEAAGIDAINDPKDYIYVPFLPTDNPHFTEELWASMTATLDPRVREARRYGRWDFPEGAVFQGINDEDHRFITRDLFTHGIPHGWEIRIGVDYGIRDPFCALWTILDKENRRAYTYREIYKARITPDEQARLVHLATTPAERKQVRSVWFDPSMFNKLPNHTGEVTYSVADIYRTEWSAYPEDERLPVPRHGFNRSRVQALGFLHRLLGRTGDSWEWYISTDCENLWGELTSAVYPAERHRSVAVNEDLDPKCADHAITASYYHLYDLVYRPPMQAAKDNFEGPPRVRSGVRFYQP
jgi:hypothetical protein